MARVASMWTSSGIPLAVCAALAACEPSISDPELHSVSPGWGYNGTQTAILLAGDNLFPEIEASDGQTIDLDKGYRAWVATSPPTELAAVDLIDTHRISAVVPIGLDPGLYDLQIESPSGSSAELADAFQVTDTLADHIRATSEQLTWTVQDNAVVSLQVRDLSEAIVALPLEVRVGATGSAVTDGFKFKAGTLEGQTPDAVSGGIRGSLRADGQGYIAFSTPTPGDVNLVVEPVAPDSIIGAGIQTVTFEAGEAMSLALSLPNGGFATTAGASFEVGVRLVDSLGNTVNGVPASVLLTETCPGGTMSTFIPLVDDATAVVSATAATNTTCTHNQIAAIGVVEGGTILGTSDNFEVHPGILHHLDVAAAPTMITAGTDELTVSVVAADAWSNRVDSAGGGVSLSDETGPLRPESGNGTQSCGELAGGVGICTATLYQGGFGRILTATTDAGAEGNANPVTVLPGPGDHIEVKIDITEVQAGVMFDATVSLLDFFDNAIEISESDLDGIAFYDGSGPVSCLPDTVDEAVFAYRYSCTCTRALADNVLHVVLDTLASSGASSPFDVRPGPLSSVDVTLGLEGVGERIQAGDSVTAGLIGFDAYGNPVSDELTIDLSDTAGGMTPSSVALTEGHATLSLVFANALAGNTVSAFNDEQLLGISMPFEVVPGPATALSVSPLLPWAWTDGPTPLHIAPTDAYGNVVPGGEEAVVLRSSSGLGPDVAATMSGLTVVDFVFEASGLNETIEVEGVSLAGISDAFDVVLDCIDGPSVGLTVVGASHHSLCLGADDRVTATLSASPEDLLLTHFLGGSDAYRTSEPSVEHTFLGAGRTQVQALGIRSDGCAELASQTIYHGPVGPPVGAIELSVADGTLIAGTSGGDERTRVTLGARACTGDLAEGGEVLVRATLGALESTAGTALTTTGSGVQLELDGDGEASIRWTMGEVELGGTPELYVGSRTGAAFGQASANVSGDDVPPQVIETMPMGVGGASFSEVEIFFTEPMLMSLGEETLMDAVELVDPDGETVEWLATGWSSDGVVLTMYMSEPREPIEGTWTLWVYDELRDSGGNRLDGDLDGDSGGTLTLEFGNVLDTAPSVTECQPTTSTIRPDGDDGEGLEADAIELSIATDTPAAWWQTEVLDAEGVLVLHRREAPVGTATGAIAWDGRGQDGQVVGNGLYRLDLTPTDMHWNLGHGCTMAVQIDNHLSPQDAP